MKPAAVLVVAKAPVAGLVKTRLARSVGNDAAADLAAAALLDTMQVCESAFPADRRLLALAGSLAEAARGREIADRARDWVVIRQRGTGLAARLAAAHSDAARIVGGPIVQIGMDTPHVSRHQLLALLGPLEDACNTSTRSDRRRRYDAVLAPAVDGGWWALALPRPALARSLTDIAMSTALTGRDTWTALHQAGADIWEGPSLRDIDDAADAEAVSLLAPDLRFARAWAAMRCGCPA